MRFSHGISTGIVAGILLAAIPASPKAQDDVKWEGWLRDSTKVTGPSLRNILNLHSEWLSSNELRGRRADLREAVLTEVDLSGANLSRADLRKAFLLNANLRQADLSGANLSGAFMRESDLTKANLNHADLQEANLGWAYLREADLSGANLERAYLGWASLYGADLSEARLRRTYLREVDLGRADLSRAILDSTDLYRADLHGANLAGVVFDLWPWAIPEVRSLVDAENLSKMTFRDSVGSLALLRKALRDSCLYEQERQITYAIEHGRRLKATDFASNTGLLQRSPGYVRSGLRLILFEITCEYGLSPRRPLMILLVLIVAFALPYSLVRKDGRYAGLWAVPRATGRDPFRMVAWWSGFYFSAWTALRPIGAVLGAIRWILRLRPATFDLGATGWVRPLWVVQWLVSAYLLILWILTTWWRPFG